MTILKFVIFLVVVGIGLWKSGLVSRLMEGNETQLKQKPLAFAIIAGFLFLGLFQAVGAVPAGYRGIVLRFGGVTGRVLNEGIYLVTPLVESVVFANVQTRAYVVSATSASKDLQDVKTEVTLNYALDRTKVAGIYQELRDDYLDRVVFPAIHESVKAATADFEAEELITKRPIVKEQIEKSLGERIAEYGIVMQTLSITEFQFSPEFSSAIEEKVIASQKALKAERDLERIKIEAAQTIESAKAEAESLRLQRQNVTAELLRLREIEVQRAALEKWDGVLPQTITGNVPLPFIGVGSK
ncbi:MAG: prohibitin family protein [Candidatus Omnitrophota bacterium]